MFARNPSEYQRMIEERNNQMSIYETSRNSNTERHYKCQELREMERRLTTGRLCKKDKKVLLTLIDDLRAVLGFEPRGNYNGT